MVMSVRMALLPLIFALMIHRCFSADWVVNYKHSHICALKNSSVIMSCTYTYPTGYKIEKVFWTKTLDEYEDLSEKVNLFKDPEYSQRLQYLGDKQKNCTIRLSNVTQKDSHMYYFRFTTNVKKGRWFGKPGVNLTVTDLQVEAPERVTEGDSVSLTCKSSCALTDRATFIWYRNSQLLTEKRYRNNQLLLQSVRREDAGKYSCALRGHNYISPAVQLSVTWVSSADWGVNYRHSQMCALKNSSVIMSCNYTYPTGHQIMKVFWTKNPLKVGEEYPDLSEDPEYSQRLQYLGDKQKNCTIRLSHVTQKDSHKYYFRFITDKPDGKWTGKPGVSLTVTDLQVESPERVTEGDSVRLTCKSSCALTDRATFIWYRNSQPLTERRDRNNQLLLQSVRREDAGRYSCALQEHTYISPAVQLSVTYPPKSVSVSISPSGVIVEGDSVTLSCSSDSNPPAEISWFKEGTIVGSGRIYSISKISSDHSGEYKCKSRNKHGEKYSDAVTLNVMYPPKSVSVFISPSGVIVEGDSVTLSCSSDSNPPAEISWFKGGTFVASGSIYNISKISSDHSEEYKCKSRNKHGEKYSDAVTLNIMYAPRNVSVSISSEEGDSVTLICSSDSNPPAEISWFKENQSSSVGSGQSFSALQSGRFYCVAHNQHGSQRSDAVPVTITGGGKTVLYTAVVIAAGCGVLFLICIIMFIRKRKSAVSDVRQKQVHCDDGLHARVSIKRPSADQTAGKTIKTVYAMVQHVKNNKSNENLTVHHPDPAARSDAMVGKSVIYSKVK
uniref:B-cell receptor CD22 n=1 Tax=Cyprinus carpio carpio TaxID=630221 RepID=A0A8C1H7F8_CYPCA